MHPKIEALPLSNGDTLGEPCFLSFDRCARSA